MWLPYLFDMWTAIHFVGWLGVAFTLVRVGLRPYLVVALLLFLSVGWEFIEPLTVEKILGFKEPWYNRWITDILADVFGIAIGVRLAKLFNTD